MVFPNIQKPTYSWSFSSCSISTLSCLTSIDIQSANLLSTTHSFVVVMSSHVSLALPFHHRKSGRLLEADCKSAKLVHLLIWRGLYLMLENRPNFAVTWEQFQRTHLLRWLVFDFMSELAWERRNASFMNACQMTIGSTFIAIILVSLRPTSPTLDFSILSWVEGLKVSEKSVLTFFVVGWGKSTIMVISWWFRAGSSSCKIRSTTSGYDKLMFQSWK